MPGLSGAGGDALPGSCRLPVLLKALEGASMAWWGVALYQPLVSTCDRFPARSPGPLYPGIPARSPMPRSLPVLTVRALAAARSINPGASRHDHRASAFTFLTAALPHLPSRMISESLSAALGCHQ